MRTAEVLIPFRPGLDPHHRTGEPTDYRTALYLWCWKRWEALGFTVRTGDSPIDPFTRGHALNELAAKSDATHLILADADTVVTSDLRQLIREGDFDNHWYIGYGRGRYWSLSYLATRMLLQSDPGAPLEAPKPGEYIAVTENAVSGCVILSHEAFDAVGGFDRRVIGWGEDDWILKYALDTLWGPCQRLDGDAIHCWHPHVERQRFEQRHYRTNKELCLRYEAVRGDRDAMRSLVDEQFR